MILFIGMRFIRGRKLSDLRWKNDEGMYRDDGSNNVGWKRRLRFHTVMHVGIGSNLRLVAVAHEIARLISVAELGSPYRCACCGYLACLRRDRFS